MKVILLNFNGIYNINIQDNINFGPGMMMVNFDSIQILQLLNGNNIFFPLVQSKCLQLPHICLERIQSIDNDWTGKRS